MRSRILSYKDKIYNSWFGIDNVPNGPVFVYQEAELDVFERQFLQTSGVLIGAFKHIRDDDKNILIVDIISEEDGNGRIGRAIAEKALAQSFGQPTLIALSHAIQKYKNNYYDALEHNNKDSEIITNPYVS